MKCSELGELLSAYYDDELVDSRRVSASAHIESCSSCASELAGFTTLSTTVKRSHCPPPPQLWTEIEAQLNASACAELIQFHRSGGAKWSRLASARLVVAIAASLILAAWGGRSFWRGSRTHADLAHDMSFYIAHLQSEPSVARERLVAKYARPSTGATDTLRQMAFRPTGEFGLPHGYSPVASDVLDMPCCKCIAVMCAREDGTILAIFEHETAHPPWFGDRPAIQAHCSDQSVRLVQLGVNHLAATWPLNDRYVTIIGARDIDEIARLVSHFSNLN